MHFYYSLLCKIAPAFSSVIFAHLIAIIIPEFSCLKIVSTVIPSNVNHALHLSPGFLFHGIFPNLVPFWTLSQIIKKFCRKYSQQNWNMIYLTNVPTNMGEVTANMGEVTANSGAGLLQNVCKQQNIWISRLLLLHCILFPKYVRVINLGGTLQIIHLQSSFFSETAVKLFSGKTFLWSSMNF